MRVVETSCKAGTHLIEDFLYQFDNVKEYFQYNPFDSKSWPKRCQWLDEHPLKHRSELVDGLRLYNTKIGNERKALANIDLLEDPGTLVVAGGQQAGILLGPMYVVHKAVTLIQLAKKMQEELGRNIIPVFWIASEDHDFDEVNHTYVMSTAEQVKKIMLSWSPGKRNSVSHLDLGADSLLETTKQFFSLLPDSEHFSDLYTKVHQFAKESTKLNEFFARIMAWLFGEHGLVLIDSADQFVRELETPMFRTFLTHEFKGELQMTENRLVENGYHRQVEWQEESTQLFYYTHEERHLLLRKNGKYITKNGEHEFTQEELLQQVEEHPEFFSANVISRPIMQEHLLPVLAFVGGPGEISYWAQLKKVFVVCGLQMPIVFPRMTFTLIERNIASYMDRFHLSYTQAENWQDAKKNWLGQQYDVDLVQQFKGFMDDWIYQYRLFGEQLAELEPWARNLVESNEKRIVNHMQFLQNKTWEALEARHLAALNQWESIGIALYPLDKPQERVYNVFGYLNKYGKSLLTSLLDSTTLSLQAAHRLVYI
jgi:bacillithiol synthase